MSVDLEAVVRSRFADGPPNGWLERWDVDRFSEELKALARPDRLSNLTSFDDAFGNTYKVAIEPGRTGSTLSLTIKISFIADAFCLYWQSTGRNGTPRRLAPGEPDGAGRPLEERIRAFFARRAFVEVSAAEFGRPIEVVATELGESDRVTLGQCLFDDHA